MDWEFIAILKMRILNEKQQTDSTKSNIELENAMPNMARQKVMKETSKGCLLSNFETNQPEMGSPANELRGMANRILPNCASLRLKSSLMVGMREAQEAKQKPERKK